MVLPHVIEGTGPAVLLLHSTSADSRQWERQIQGLSQEFTVLAPDLRGFGRSPLTYEPFSHAGDDVGEQELEVDLAAITCPATIVSGARDLAWFSAVADHLAAGLPAATRLELPWAGHLPNLERPAETTQLIRTSIRP